MIGQELLSNKINQYTLDTFPRSIILLGDTGSGRHTLCNDIADRLKIEKVIIDSPIHSTILKNLQLGQHLTCIFSMQMFSL